jgi:hypothetical protein
MNTTTTAIPAAFLSDIADIRAVPRTEPSVYLTRTGKVVYRWEQALVCKRMIDQEMINTGCQFKRKPMPAYICEMRRMYRSVL